MQGVAGSRVKALLEAASRHWNGKEHEYGRTVDLANLGNLHESRGSKQTQSTLTLQAINKCKSSEIVALNADRLCSPVRER